MSCGSCHSNPCSCEDVCDPNNEPLASALNNFIASFFGSISKTCVDDQVQWILPCDLNTGIAGFERRQGEGTACYLLRLFDYLNGIVVVGISSCFSFHDKIAINGVCYDTWQSAYDANVAMASPVLMLVGEGSFGDLTLTSDYNSNILVVGFGSGISILGNVNASSVSNGNNVNITAGRLTLGNIDTSTSDPTVSFSGGNVTLNSKEDLIVGDINTSAFGGFSGGTVTFNGIIISGDIDSNGTLGNVIIDDECTVGNIVTNGNGIGGTVTLGDNVTTSNISTHNSGSAVGAGGFIMCGRECRLGNLLADGKNGGAITIGDESLSGTITSKPNAATFLGGVILISDDCSTGNIDNSGTIAGTFGAAITIADRCETGSITASGSSGGGVIVIGEGLTASGNITSESTLANNGGSITISHRLTLAGSVIASGFANGGAISIGQNANISTNITAMGGVGSTGPVVLGDGSHYATLDISTAGAVGSIQIGKFSVIGSVFAVSSGSTRSTIMISDGTTLSGNLTATALGNCGTITIGNAVTVTGNINAGSTSGNTGAVTVGMSCNLLELRVGSGTGSTNGIVIGQATKATLVLCNTGGGVGQTAGNITLGEGSHVNEVFTNAFNAGAVAGSITMEPGATATQLRCESTSSTGGSVTLKNSNVVTGSAGTALMMGSSSTGTILAINAKISDQIDNVNGSSLFRDTVFSTPAANRDCIANLTASGSQYTNCLFVPNGTGDSIDASAPQTIIGYNILQKNPFSANVTLSEGNETTSANLLAP